MELPEFTMPPYSERFSHAEFSAVVRFFSHLPAKEIAHLLWSKYGPESTPLSDDSEMVDMVTVAMRYAIQVRRLVLGDA